MPWLDVVPCSYLATLSAEFEMWMWSTTLPSLCVLSNHLIPWIIHVFWVFFFWPCKVVVLMCPIRPAHIWTRFWSNKNILACISWCSCIHVASILLVEYEVLCVSVKLCFCFYLCWMDEISWSPEFPRFLLVAGIQWFSGCWWRTTLLEWQRFWWESSDCGVCQKGWFNTNSFYTWSWMMLCLSVEICRIFH